MTDALLTELGWNDSWEAKRVSESAGGEPARVVRHDAVKVLVANDVGVRHVTFSRTTPLAVGDWVLVENETVTTVLERANILERDNAEFGTQIIAANIDAVFVVFGSDRELKQRKVMRFVAFAGDIGAKPIVVVTKADLVSSADEYVEMLADWVPDVKVLVTSVTTGVGINELFDEVGGRTGTFIGESGAGKSSLVNALMEEEVAWIGDVRERDAKGRHTTTHREMHRLPGGGLIIDNPGIRALGLAADGGGVDTVFADVEELSQGCKFRDCAHSSEPGCAVLAAIENGDLSAERWSAYLHFVEEQNAASKRASDRLRRAAARADAQSAQQARDAASRTDY